PGSCALPGPEKHIFYSKPGPGQRFSSPKVNALAFSTSVNSSACSSPGGAAKTGESCRFKLSSAAHAGESSVSFSALSNQPSASSPVSTKDHQRAAISPYPGDLV